MVVGVVESISLGYTVLRTDDRREIVIANGTMAQQTTIKLAPAAENRGQTTVSAG